MKTYTMHALVFLDLTASPPTVARILLTSSRHVTMNMTREAATELWSASSPVSLADARQKLLRVLSKPPFEWTLPWLRSEYRESVEGDGEPRTVESRSHATRRPFHGPGGE